MSLCSHMRVTPCYGELSMKSVTSCKKTSAFATQIAHSLKWGTFGGICAHWWNAVSPDFRTSAADYRSSHMQSERTKGVYFWMSLICISFMLQHPSQITQENKSLFFFFFLHTFQFASGGV